MRKTIILFVIFIQFGAIAQSPPMATADSLYALGNYGRAINQYAKEHSLAAKLQIARAYNAIGNYDKSILEYEAILVKDPTMAIARFELGKICIATSRFEQAADLFADLIQDGTQNPEYFYYMGRTLFELGDGRQGLHYFKSAVLLDSTHVRSMYQLGKHYVINREKDSVLKYVDIGLRYFENDVSLLNWKAQAYYNNTEYDKAIPYFERLLALQERKQYIYEKLAFCYFKSWEFEKAKTTYHIVLGLEPDLPEAHYNLGQVFWKDRQLDSAQYYIKKSIELQKPMLSREYEALAQLARQQKDLNAALEYYKMAYAEDGGNHMIYYNICTVVDQLVKDPKVRLNYYENFLNRFSMAPTYFTETVSKRITEIKAEIHLAKE